MSYDSNKSSAQIEREIDNDRHRIEEKLSAIQERLTPGQMIDEALGYAKAHGGGEYFANLGNSIKANPLPAALMGVSLAWLMASSGTNHSAPRRESRWYEDDNYPLATVAGEIRRTGPARMENGENYTYFSDTAGKRFTALTDDAGRRAGHFIDDAGQTFRGFADTTGRQISQMRDEAGAWLDEASGWASETWRMAKDSLSGMGSSISGAGSALRRSSTSAMSGLQSQSSRLNDMILHQFRDQPLVGGALAFAIGAAIGAALPHTDTEDEMLGEAADDMRNKVSDQASGLLDKGQAAAEDVYRKAAAVASDVHDAAKDRIQEEAQKLGQTGNGHGASAGMPH
jgi:hypothetical protein